MTLDTLDIYRPYRLVTVKGKSDLQQPQVYRSVKNHKFLLSVSTTMNNNLVKEKYS